MRTMTSLDRYIPMIDVSMGRGVSGKCCTNKDRVGDSLGFRFRAGFSEEDKKGPTRTVCSGICRE